MTRFYTAQTLAKLNAAMLGGYPVTLEYEELDAILGHIAHLNEVISELKRSAA